MRHKPFLAAIVLGIAYGLCARVVFGLDVLQDLFGVMTIAFIFGVPFGLGYLTISVAAPQRALRWWHYLLLPWVPSVLALIAALALAWEGLICIFLWLPLFMLLSSLGGMCAGLLRLLAASKRTNGYVLASFVLLPFVLSPLEKQMQLPLEHRRVETHIEIHSDPRTVWNNIKSVSTIREEEQTWSWFQLIGFPRPIAATLSYEGIGATRYATFAGDILFIETISRWIPEETLTFSIQADPSTIPAHTLDAHVTVGGPFFDVLEGEYHVQTMAHERIMLHLHSTYRLSTPFNIYAGMWTDFIMRDIQHYILNILKQRCERAGRSM
jgi:hypothetical protein